MTEPYPLHASGVVSRALKVYLVALFSLWSLAILIVGVRRFVLHHAYPLNTFFFTPTARYSDFTIYATRFAVWGQGDRFFSLPGFPFDYPPPILVSELAFYKFTSQPLHAYLITIALFAVAGGLLVAMAVPDDRRVRYLAVAAALATAVFSYPLMFLLDRGNIEGVVWIATSVGLLFFVRRSYSWSALFLALAAAMKIFPGTLLFLLLARRRHRDFCLSLFAIGVITYLSLWIAGPTPSVAGEAIIRGMDHLRSDQILRFKTMEVGFDHSVWSLMKQVLFRVCHNFGPMNFLLPKLYLIYGVCAIAGFVVLYLKVLRLLPLLNQILALSSLAILLPFVSFDYTLVHMFAPFSILILVIAKDGASGRLRLSQPQLLCFLVPFAVIFTPQSYLLMSSIGFDGQIKAIALIFLVAVSIVNPLPSSLFQELSERRIQLLNLEPVAEPEYV